LSWVSLGNGLGATALALLFYIILQLTGAKVGNRLKAEAETNLAINVLPGPLSESYEVQGRGELQLGLFC
jgi:hypothetical protein